MRRWKQAFVGWSCTCSVLTVAMLKNPQTHKFLTATVNYAMAAAKT